MRAELLTYWQLARAGFRQQSRYRLATFAGLLTNVVFGFLKAAVLFAAVRAAGGDLRGYGVGAMSAYVWLSQGLLGAVQAHGKAEIGERIRTGDVAVDFLRPVDVQLSHLAADLGKASFSLIPRGIPSVLVGALTVGIVMPRAPLPYLLGVVSVVLGMAISFCGRYAVNVLGFWLVETRGMQLLYMVASTFLMGMFVPVSLFPGWLGALASATPFPSIMMAPIDVLSGRKLGLDALRVLGLQLFWLGVTFLLGHLLTTAGRRKLEVQGG
ncbi:MAG TPA: ABC-2 family transporter protein [Segeticoccus sp.]|uniref:ABC transporter permease n=1 Tax=Segeticoccus sp. TaxID=2706531 RepID=UPI002D7E5CF7|nr:ABC-2 family transporter protein [Segeticoccus sp.]HET8599151.1 ABC-2 family transporter protein [Segeticoccus sp.]